MKERHALITEIPLFLKDLRPPGDTALHLNIKYVMQNLLVLTDSARVPCPGQLAEMQGCLEVSKENASPINRGCGSPMSR